MKVMSVMNVATAIMVVVGLPLVYMLSSFLENQLADHKLPMVIMRMGVGFLVGAWFFLVMVVRRALQDYPETDATVRRALRDYLKRTGS